MFSGATYHGSVMVPYLQGLNLLQGDAIFAPTKLLQEVLLAGVLIAVQQVHQAEQLSHVILDWGSCISILMVITRVKIITGMLFNKGY